MFMLAENLGQWITAASVVVAATVFCALYCGMETGIYVLNKIRLDLHAEAHRRGARSLRRQLRHPQNLLVVLLVGTNIAAHAVTYAVKAMFALGGAADHRAEWYTIAVATPLLLILGDSVPKNIFQRASETLTYRLAWLMRASSIVLNACGLAPLVRGCAWLVTALAGKRGMSEGHALGHTGLAAIVAEGHASGAMSMFQSRMAERVMHLEDVCLIDVMVPMDKVVWAAPDADRATLVELLRGHEFRRLPMREPGGQVVGVLDIYDALTTDTEPSDPLVLEADLGVTDALYRMQRAHAPMGIVADDRRRHVGIVTVKDLVEEIVGELGDW